MGEGGGEKNKHKKSCKGKVTKKICAKKMAKKKTMQKEKSYCGYYLIHKICHAYENSIIGVSKIQNVLGSLPKALLYYYL